MKCIIPCGGFGTRMQKLGLNKPKSLVEVKGIPILEHILRRVEEVDEVDEVFVVSNGFFFKDFSDWLEGFQCSKKIRLLSDGLLRNEDRKGALPNALQALQWLKRAGVEDDLLIVYGDNLFDFDLKEFVVKFVENGKDLVAVCDIGSLEKAKLFGVITVGEGDIITKIEEKPENPDSTLISTGVYLFRKESVPWFFKDYSFTNDAGFTHVIVNIYPETPVMVYTIPNGCLWFDIGAPENYSDACEKF